MFRRMFIRAVFGLILVAVAALLSVSQAQAQCAAGGYLIQPSADYMTGPGDIMGGTYLNAQTSNNEREAFNERLQNGVSRLYHVWKFDNVPAGDITMHREGYRLGSADADNFTFQAYYWLNGGPYYIFGSFCTISSETEGSQTCSFNHETDDTRTWYISILDTVTQSGTALSAVSVDRIVLCSNPPQCIPPPGEMCE